MVILLGALLVWQHQRERLVAECVANGGTWDGVEGRCKLVPPIYLERGIKRSQPPPFARPSTEFAARQNRSIR